MDHALNHGTFTFDDRTTIASGLVPLRQNCNGRHMDELQTYHMYKGVARQKLYKMCDSLGFGGTFVPHARQYRDSW